MAMSAPGTVGSGQIRFDLGVAAAVAVHCRQGSTDCSTSPPTPIWPRPSAPTARPASSTYLSSGQGRGPPGRPVQRDPVSAELRRPAGRLRHDVNAATAHYISNGCQRGPGRRRRLAGQIDGLQYIASNADLIAAFGANAAAGQEHYASNGQAEGRVLDNFNETQYLANYGDLQAAFGDNTDAATAHYITNGFAEGRNDFLV